MRDLFEHVQCPACFGTGSIVVRIPGGRTTRYQKLPCPTCNSVRRRNGNKEEQVSDRK